MTVYFDRCYASQTLPGSGLVLARHPSSRALANGSLGVFAALREPFAAPWFAQPLPPNPKTAKRPKSLPEKLRLFCVFLGLFFMHELRLYMPMNNLHIACFLRHAVFILHPSSFILVIAPAPQIKLNQSKSK